MAGYYDKNKDYAAAIKNTTDSKERDKLISERQNKIDDMNSKGTNKGGYTNDIYKNSGSSSSKNTGSSSSSSSKNTGSSSSSGSKNSSSSNYYDSGSSGSSKSSGYYDPNKDYAAAISATNDAAERQRLIAERQNKINAMNAGGTNTKGYTNSIYGYDLKSGNSTTEQKYTGKYSDYVKGITSGSSGSIGSMSERELSDRINSIVERMQDNSRSYSTADEMTQKSLKEANQSYAQQLNQLGVGAKELTPGAWYYTNKKIADDYLEAYGGRDNGTGYYKLYDVPFFDANDNTLYQSQLQSQANSLPEYMTISEEGSQMEPAFSPYVNIPEYQGMSAEQIMSMYNAAAEELANGRYAQLDSMLNDISGQKATQNQQFDELMRQAYVAKRQGEVALPQQLAALGISGGASESTNLGLQTNYQNNLNSTELSRQQALQELERLAYQAQMQADSDVSGYYADAQQSAVNDMQQAYAGLNSHNQWGAGMQLQMEQLRKQGQEQEYQRLLEQQRYADSQRQYERQYQDSLRQYQDGLHQYDLDLALKIGDYDKLKSMGYDTNYLETMRQYELAQLAAQARKNASRSSGGGSTDTSAVTTGSTDSSASMQIANQNGFSNGENWIEVPGYGTLTLAQLQHHIAKGNIREIRPQKDGVSTSDLVFYTTATHMPN